jgi:hypothetical protein
MVVTGHTVGSIRSEYRWLRRNGLPAPQARLVMWRILRPTPSRFKVSDIILTRPEVAA